MARERGFRGGIGVAPAALVLLAVLGFAPLGVVAQDQAPKRNLLSRDLPRWFDLGIETRFRGETRFNPVFVDDLDTTLGFSRLRLSAGFTPSKRVRFFFQGQDSRYRVVSKEPNQSLLQNTFDVRQAYVDFGNDQDTWWRLRMGRQVVMFGNERFLGERRWPNFSPTWDAAMLTLRKGKDRVDVFAMAIVKNDPLRRDRPFQAGNLHGAYGKIESWIPNASFEPYLLFSSHPRAGFGQVRAPGGGSWTRGFRIEGDGPGPLNYEVEMANQTGSAPGTSIRAWMGVWRLGVAPKAAPWESDVSLQGEFASGDDNPADGLYGTFDPLYGARKKFLGMMNLIGRRNLKSLRTAWEAHPRDNLRLRAKLFQYWLASRRDGLYAMSGRRLLSVAPGGAAAGRIGSELDFEVRFKPVTYLTVEAGMGRFIPGPFVREARGNPPAPLFGYVSLDLKL